MYFLSISKIIIALARHRPDDQSIFSRDTTAIRYSARYTKFTMTDNNTTQYNTTQHQHNITHQKVNANK